MAEALKREFGLVDLEVALDLDGRRPRVWCRLEGTEDGRRVQFQEWRWDAQELGVPDRRAKGLRSAAVELPDDFGDQLHGLLEEVAAPEAPLWLHLARPAGLLAAMPWERSLQPVAGRPVLRIPDFRLKPSTVTSEDLEVALLASQPAAKLGFDLLGEVEAVIEALRTADHDRRAKVHLFADSQHYHALTARYEGAEWVEVHDPTTAAGFEEPESSSRVSASSRIENSWLLWMLERLAGRAIDAIHFVGHGYLALGRGSIALAPGPLSNEDSRWSRFVGAAELQQFATALGAVAVSFTSVPGNYSDLGLRMMAHEIADRRPGPVLVYDSGRDPERSALRQAFAVIHGRPPQPPPDSDAVTLYCQPFRVTPTPEAQAQAEGAPARPAVRRPQRRRAREASAQKGPTAPVWSRSLARYLEEQRVELDRMEKSERSSAKRDAAVLESTLSSISEVLESAVERSGK